MSIKELAEELELAIDKLRVAINQVEQRPIAWMVEDDEVMFFSSFEEAALYCADDEDPVPLYDTPQKLPEFSVMRAKRIRDEARKAAQERVKVMAWYVPDHPKQYLSDNEFSLWRSFHHVAEAIPLVPTLEFIRRLDGDDLAMFVEVGK